MTKNRFSQNVHGFSMVFYGFLSKGPSGHWLPPSLGHSPRAPSRSRRPRRESSPAVPGGTGGREATGGLSMPPRGKHPEVGTWVPP